MIDRAIHIPEGVPSLTTYYVYLTAGCNLACQHCWIAPTYQANGGTGGHLDYDLFALAIREGIPLGLNHVKLTGGEPLLHPDFIRIIDLIKENNLGLTIETNGTLLTATLAQYLKEKSTLGFISVSLDGSSAETHDAFRGVKGSFEQACQAIRFLAAVGFQPQVIMSLHSGNVDDIEALVRLSWELGAGSVKFNVIQESGRGEIMTKRGKNLEFKKFIEVGRWVEGKFQKQIPIRLIYSWPMAFFNLNHLININGYSCDLKHILGILSSGHLALCGIGIQEPELIYGRLGDDSLKKIWYAHPKLIDLRKDLPSGLQGICGECVFRDFCIGVCVAQNYHVYKNLTAPHWFCDQADKLGLFPNTRKRRIK